MGVGGECRLGNERSPKRPFLLLWYIGDIEGLSTGTWATDEDVNQKGGLILWYAHESPDQTVPNWVHLRFPRAELLPEILEIPYTGVANILPLRIGIAIIPPPENR